MPFCESKLWCNYHKYNFRQLRVAYNDSYTILHRIPRCVSACNYQVQSNFKTLEALIRKHIFFLSLIVAQTLEIFLLCH